MIQRCCRRFRRWLRGSFAHDEDVPEVEMQSFRQVVLADVWRPLLSGGQLHTALTLSTVFSEKYKGRSMQPGEKAEVRLPVTDAETKSWSPTLLFRAGSREAVCFIWLGDETANDRTLYVAFSPLRKRRQFLKVLHSSKQDLVEVALEGGWGAPINSRLRFTSRNTGSCFMSTESGFDDQLARSTTSMRMLSYVHRKIENLEHRYGLDGMLLKAHAAYPSHRMVFTGLSHGATLAQASAIKFKLANPASNVLLATWNGYRWTDDAGSALFRYVFGEKCMPLVISRQKPGEPRRWDSVVGFPAGLTALPNMLLLDVDSGDILCSEMASSAASRLTRDSFSRFVELHFANTALLGSRRFMISMLQSEASTREVLSKTLRDSISDDAGWEGLTMMFFDDDIDTNSEDEEQFESCCEPEKG